MLITIDNNNNRNNIWWVEFSDDDNECLHFMFIDMIEAVQSNGCIIKN